MDPERFAREFSGSERIPPNWRSRPRTSPSRCTVRSPASSG